MLNAKAAASVQAEREAIAQWFADRDQPYYAAAIRARSG